VLDTCLAPLNSLPVFKGTLKIATLKDRWRKAEKIAEDIMGDEEKFLKLAQNGGKALSKLDSLYLNLAKRMKKHRDDKQKEKDDTAAEKSDAQHRLTAAMKGVAKRCGYSSMSQAEQLLREEEREEQPSQGDDVKSPSPSNGQKDRSPSALPQGEGSGGIKEASGGKEPAGGSGGSGGSSGGSAKHDAKRAKPNPALKPDRNSADPLSVLADGSNRMFDYLQAQSESDKALFGAIAQAQSDMARAAVMTAQAERLKQAAAAAQSFIQSTTAGIVLPPGLLALFNDPS